MPSLGLRYNLRSIGASMSSESHRNDHRQQHVPALPQRCHAALSCPRDLVGRVIGKRGATVKGIQRFSGAVVEVNQVFETIVILGSPESVHTATSIIKDIISGSFKGFGLLRHIVNEAVQAVPAADEIREQFVYAPGFGMFPERQLFAVVAANAGHTAAFSDQGSERAKPWGPIGSAGGGGVDVARFHHAPASNPDAATALDINNSGRDNNTKHSDASASTAIQHLITTTTARDKSALPATVEPCLLRVYQQQQQQQLGAQARLGLQAMPIELPTQWPYPSTPGPFFLRTQTAPSPQLPTCSDLLFCWST